MAALRPRHSACVLHRRYLRRLELGSPTKPADRSTFSGHESAPSWPGPTRTLACAASIWRPAQDSVFSRGQWDTILRRVQPGLRPPLLACGGARTLCLEKQAWRGCRKHLPNLALGSWEHSSRNAPTQCAGRSRRCMDSENLYPKNDPSWSTENGPRIASVFRPRISFYFARYGNWPYFQGLFPYPKWGRFLPKLSGAVCSRGGTSFTKLLIAETENDPASRAVSGCPRVLPRLAPGTLALRAWLSTRLEAPKKVRSFWWHLWRSGGQTWLLPPPRISSRCTPLRDCLQSPPTAHPRIELRCHEILRSFAEALKGTPGARPLRRRAGRHGLPRPNFNPPNKLDSGSEFFSENQACEYTFLKLFENVEANNASRPVAPQSRSARRP